MMKGRKLFYFVTLLLAFSLGACSNGGDDDSTALIPPLSKDLEGWEFKVDSSGGANGAISASDGVASVSVVSGGTKSSQINLATKEPLSLAVGNTYRIRYTVTGTSGCTVFCAISNEAGTDADGDGDPWTFFAPLQNICDGTKQAVSRVFKVAAVSGTPHLFFEFGSWGHNGTDNTGATCSVSDVTLEDLGADYAPGLTGSELFLNGDFSYESLNWKTIYLWNEAIAANVSFTDKTVNAQIVDSGSKWWHIAVQSIDWIQLEAGKSYTLSFTCSGQAGKTMKVSIQEEGTDGDNDAYRFTHYFRETVSFDGTSQTKTFTFTPPVTNKYMTVKFGLGYNEEENINNDNGSVTIDDVSLKPTP